MNILVTGGSGQLGQEIHHMLGDSRHTWHFPGHDEFDITDPDSIESYVRDNNIGIVLNLAAYTNVDISDDEKIEAFVTNVCGPAYLSMVLKKYDGKLIHVSTDYVFGPGHDTPIPTCADKHPECTYGSTKSMGEDMLMTQFGKDMGCPYMIVRTSWLYGRYGKNFMKTMMNLFGTRNVVDVVDDQCGTPTWTRDLAGFLIDIIENDKFFMGIWHYSDEGVCSWYDFAVAIKEYSGNTRVKVLPYKSNSQQAKRPRYSVLDKTTTRAVFDIRIPHWTESLKKCLQEIKVHGTVDVSGHVQSRQEEHDESENIGKQS